MAQTGGYPSLADIEDYIAEMGIEEITQGNTNFRQEFLQLLYRLLKRAEAFAVLSVYCPTSTTFNIIGGNYNYNGTVKTYVPGAAVNPTDNDTTYIWLTAANAIGSGIDGSGWPVTEHVKLAEIDVDSDGVITEIRDLRVQAVNITAAV